MDLPSRVSRLEQSVAEQNVLMSEMKKDQDEMKADVKAMLELIAMARGIRWFMTIVAGLLAMFGALGLRDWIVKLMKS